MPNTYKINIEKLPVVVPNNDRKVIIELQKKTIYKSNSEDYSDREIKKLVEMSNEGIIFRRGVINFKAIRDNELVGIASISESGIIASIFVLPEHQGQSCGTLLLSAIEEEAKNSGISHIWLTSSITARHFFEKSGYKLLLSARTSGNIPVRIMSKCLTSNKSIKIRAKEMSIILIYLLYTMLFRLNVIK